MVLSEIQQAQVVKRLTAFCESRVPLAMHDRLRVGFRIKGNAEGEQAPTDKAL